MDYLCVERNAVFRDSQRWGRLCVCVSEEPRAISRPCSSELALPFVIHKDSASVPSHPSSL